MAEDKMMRLSQVARKLNVGKNTIIEALENKGYEVENSPNAKITFEQFQTLAKEFESSALDKEEASGLTIGKKHVDNLIIDQDSDDQPKKEEEEEIFIKNVSVEKNEATADEEVKQEEAEDPQEKEQVDQKEEAVDTKPKLKGIKVVGKIDLDKSKTTEKNPEPESKEEIVEEKEEPKKEDTTPVEEPVAKTEEVAEEIEAKEEIKEEESVEIEPQVNEETVEEKSDKKVAREGKSIIKAKADTLKGLKVLGKIELPTEKEKTNKKDQPVASSDAQKEKKKRPRKRVQLGNSNQSRTRDNKFNKGASKDQGKKRIVKEEPSDKEIQEKIKATLAKLSGGGNYTGKTSRSKYRKEKRSAIAEAKEERMLQEQEDSKTLKVTEFISANDLASLMNISVNEVISMCMTLGMFVSINQRLDAEAITVIADEFGYTAEFTSSEEEVEVVEETDEEGDLTERAPIVTIMGHVDHGKTSLLDFIRNSKVTEGEAGGITQHIGAYDVTTDSGKRIAFLDTPGHEAFTAMRARGAKVTDVVIIVVAADDSVMPQTKEALNHAQVAGVPIVIAINKIDKPTANPDKIKEELANMNVLVEDWGGKYQCQEISAKTGQGINDLLEKVLLEAELLELKANADKKAVGTVIEAELDKGRGYVTTVLVQSGTLRIGDVVLAGAHYGRVKAMFDHRGNKIKNAGPSTPVQMLGFDGAPQAGDKLNGMENEREAREFANKREQILREQNIRTKKHITLDEIGRRLAIGSFKELNIIVKGDVDGSVEALSDSLLKLSTDEVQVNIISKAVGQISESDVLLASASDAVIVGFQVRPSNGARKLAENEEIEIRLYSIIYDAINDVKDAMEGMLAPTVEEVITGNIEIREIFKISKVGTVAGCYVTDGTIKRNNQIRLIRDGIVIYTGDIDQLKRFKDDVNEVKSGYECGLSIKNFNDIKVGDTVEGFEEREVKRTL
ncbi:translation initiation factor IF-2 [Fulvivirgaceae bacterium BMA10]|uniref:Translation initiation factor IF-2 n=1 Tax=Splendidivirga corallicola TaxID=3051826 RepID=A0ABT8KM96_9BACT|nr:translation initiation factor IF-2 [Fulvivirgaceae bacterium BMA10]